MTGESFPPGSHLRLSHRFREPNDVKLTLPADAVREWRRRGKLTAYLMVRLRFRLGRVTEKPLAHCTSR